MTDLDAGFVSGLYTAFIRDVMQTALAGAGWVPHLYYADPQTDPPFLSGYRPQCAVVRQEGGDLGERMFRAARRCFEEGYRRVVIIGTDCPEVTADDLRAAFAELERNEFCLGPSADGGYYLIGMSVLRDEPFAGIDWGTATVLSKTLEIIAQIEHNVSLLSEKEDIDTLASLRNFIRRNRDVPAAQETAQFIRENQHRLPGA